MRRFVDRTDLDPTVTQSETEYGFTWARVDGETLMRSPDSKFKRVPSVVAETLAAHAGTHSIDELIAETAESNEGAADVIREMRANGFIREDAPVERVDPPADIRLWPRALVVGLVLCLTAVLWVETLSTLAAPILDQPLRYVFGTAWVSVPLIVGSVVVHEFGHYNTAWRQGLDPSVGATVINGAIPAVVTRTHDGWLLPRNRRMWNTLAGPAYGLVWTLGVFALYYAGGGHPGVAVAALFCFNMQVFVLLPIFHGDGYLLLTDLLGEENLRARGLADLRDARPTWAAAYVAVTYGFVIALFVVDVIVGYLVGELLGVAVVLGLVGAIYAESRLGLARRFARSLPP